MSSGKRNGPQALPQRHLILVCCIRKEKSGGSCHNSGGGPFENKIRRGGPKNNTAVGGSLPGKKVLKLRLLTFGELP